MPTEKDYMDERFYRYNVEGNYYLPVLVCSDDLVCSDFIICNDEVETDVVC